MPRLGYPLEAGTFEKGDTFENGLLYVVLTGGAMELISTGISSHLLGGIERSWYVAGTVPPLIPRTT